MNALAELDRGADELPQGWREVVLSDVADVNPETLRASTSPDYGFGYIDISQIEGPGQCSGWTEQTFGDAPSRARRKVQAGDILVSTVRPYLRSFAQVPDAPLPLVASTGFGVVRANRNADQQFLYQHILHSSFIDHLTPRMTGSNYPAVSARDVEAYPLLLPPLDEQRRIAEVLRSVDEAIAAKQVALSATKQFKRSCREAAVQRFQECDAIRLAELLASIDAGWSPDCESEPANDGEWSVLKTSAVVWEGYDDSENKRLPAHLEPRPQLEVAADDILITRAGPAERTGVVAIVRETAGRRMLSDKIIRLRVSSSKAVPLAIAELLASDEVQGELIRSKSGMAASQTNISQKIVLGLEMRLPSLIEQQDFADEMAALQDAIELNEADLVAAVQLKAALMSDLLSGKVRVLA